MTNFNPLGLAAKNLEFIKKTIETSLSKNNRTFVYVFGSRASGRHRKYSDLDLWIESEKTIEAKTLQALRELFSDSDLPIQVDIVTPEICLAEYSDSIQQQKKLWFSF